MVREYHSSPNAGTEYTPPMDEYAEFRILEPLRRAVLLQGLPVVLESSPADDFVD